MKGISLVLEMSACRASGTVGPRGHNYILCIRFFSLWVGVAHPEVKDSCLFQADTRYSWKFPFSELSSRVSAGLGLFFLFLY